MTISWDKKVLVGMFTIGFGALLMAFTEVDEIIAMIIVNTGSIIAVTAYAYNRRKGEVAHDERTQLISAKAASYSWMLTIILLAMFILILEYSKVTIAVQVLLGIIFAEMSISLLVFKWWLGRQ